MHRKHLRKLSQKTSTDIFKNTAWVKEPQASTSTYYSPSDILPLLKAKYEERERKTTRTKGKTAVLTLTPYLNELKANYEL